MTDRAKCELCGEPMPDGEEMFKFHGYSGNCPRPPLPREPAPDLLAEMKAAAGYLRNAKIDLETGATKATAVRTIEGGLRRLEAAILRSEALAS